MSTVNPDVPAPATAPSVQSKVADVAHQINDLLHHAVDVVRADAAAVGNHFTSLITTANVEGLIPEVEAVLALLPPKLAAGEAAVGSLLTPEDIAVLEQIGVKAAAAFTAIMKEYLARKPLAAAPTVPATPTETANAAR